MKSYLSIDMDFWVPHWTSDNASIRTRKFESAKHARTAFDSICNIIKDFGSSESIIAVMNHQQLLPYVDKSKAIRLINIDQHSDIIENPVHFCCGTWINYVRWRKTGQYLWVRPDANSLVGSMSNPWDKGGADWGETKTVYRVRNRKFKKIPTQFGDVVGLGICLSPDFCTPDLMDSFHRIVSKFKLRYLKGKLDEDLGYVRSL